MSLVIVIPLKSKKVSKNWEQVEICLQKTIKSIENQKNKNFITIIVGHEKPSFLNSESLDKRILFIEYNKQPPNITNDTAANQELYEIDRVGKIFHGFNYAKSIIREFKYFFPLDSDDLISSRFVEYVLNQNENHSIIIKNGHFYYKDLEKVSKSKNFDEYCGSSMVASVKSLKKHLLVDSIENFLFKKIGHAMMHEFLVSNNHQIIIPNEMLVMYMRDTGENISKELKATLQSKIKKYIKKLLTCKTPSNQLKNEFQI